MRDPYFGHRDWFTGEEQDDREAKTDWDYALMAAYQIIQDHTDSDGVLIWENESDNIEVNAKWRKSKFRAAVEQRTGGKKYKAQKGEYFVPDVHKMWGEYPTYSEWIDKQVKEQSE